MLELQHLQWSKKTALCNPELVKVLRQNTKRKGIKETIQIAKCIAFKRPSLRWVKQAIVYKKTFNYRHLTNPLCTEEANSQHDNPRECQQWSWTDRHKESANGQCPRALNNRRVRNKSHAQWLKSRASSTTLWGGRANEHLLLRAFHKRPFLSQSPQQHNQQLLP